MKRKWIFVFSVIIEFFLVIILMLLANQYEVAEQEFNCATGAFFFSIFFLFDCKDSEKPSKNWGEYNSMKVTFESRGKLHLYKYWSYAHLILATIIGFGCLIAGLVKLFTL